MGASKHLTMYMAGIFIGGVRMNTKKIFNIENGPSLDRLFDAFKYAYSEYYDKVYATFLIAKSYTTPPGASGRAFRLLDAKDFRLTSIQHEDGSGQSFNLAGYCKVYDTPKNFTAYYNAKTRKGTISFS